MTQLTDAGVDAITGSHVSAENPFLFDMIADFGRPFLHLDTFEAHGALVRDHPARYGMVFQTCPSETHYAAAFVRLLSEMGRASMTLRTARVGVVEMDVPSARIATAAVEASLRGIGWSIPVHRTVPISGVQWQRIVEDILDADVSMLLIAHFVPPEVTVLQRMLVEAGYRGLTYYVYTASNPMFTASLGPLAEGAIWSSVTTLDHSESAGRFRRGYRLRYGAEPGPSQASAAYDHVQLLAWAWMRNGGPDPEGTASSMREGLYRGLNGTYFFGGNDQTPLSYPDGTSDPTLGLPLVTSQIQGGASVALSPAPYGSIDRLRLPR